MSVTFPRRPPEWRRAARMPNTDIFLWPPRVAACMSWQDADLDRWVADRTLLTELLPLDADDLRALLSGASAVSIAALESRIDVVLQRGDFGGKAFVKLSCRSPKDVTVASFQTRVLWLSMCHAAPPGTDRLGLLYQAQLARLCVSRATFPWPLNSVASSTPVG